MKNFLFLGVSLNVDSKSHIKSINEVKYLVVHNIRNKIAKILVSKINLALYACKKINKSKCINFMLKKKKCQN